MHPSLEHLVKKEFNKLLATKIIFPVRHTTWVENLVLLREKKEKYGYAYIFNILNWESLKDNYLVPHMGHILKRVSVLTLLSLLYGFSIYNQVMVVK